MTDAPDQPLEPSEDGALEDEASASSSPLTEDEMGEPVALLSLLERDPGAGFLGRIRRSIERRTLGSHVSGFAWNAPFLILLSFVEMLVGITQFSPSGGSPPSRPNQNQEGSD